MKREHTKHGRRYLEGCILDDMNILDAGVNDGLCHEGGCDPDASINDALSLKQTPLPSNM